MSRSRDFDTITVPLWRRLRTLTVVAVGLVVIAASALALVRPRISYLAPPPTPAPSPDQLKVAVYPQFLDAHCGWTYIVHPTTHKTSDGLYATSDGGRVWRRVSSRVEGPFHFFDQAHGVALFPPNGSLDTTSDGGRTWHQIAEPPPLGGALEGADLEFGDSSHGAALVRSQTGSTLRITTNGIDWQQVSGLSLAVSASIAVTGYTYLVAELKNEDVVLFVSRDAGIDWTTIDTHISAQAVWALAAGPGLVVGMHSGGGTQLDVSTNYGLGWSLTGAPLSGPIGGRLACRPSGLCSLSYELTVIHATAFGAGPWSTREPAPFVDGRLFYAPDGTLFANATANGQSPLDHIFSSPNDGRNWRAITLP